MSHYKKAKEQKVATSSMVVAPTMKVTDRMNVVQCIRNYIVRMISGVKGVKVLLLDDYTKDIISVVMSQSEIMKHEVFLVGMLKDQKRQKLPNLRCIIFVRPDESNANLIRAELIEARYQAYSLYFTNVLHTDFMDKIASNDKKELVKHVYEYFADYVALDKILFTFNIPTIIPMLQSVWGEPSFKRICDGLLSVLLSVKKAKPYIRYCGSSDLCRSIAEEVKSKMDAESEQGLFQIPQSQAHKTTPPLLLLLDRREDPITPLLTQWTYQAMLHELCKMVNNRIVIGGNDHDDDEREDLDDYDEDDEADNINTSNKKNKKNEDANRKEVVVNAELDSFFANHWTSNWGDLCEAVRNVIEQYKDRNQVKGNISTIEDIGKFMKDYPEFKKFAGEVDKHATLVNTCREQISTRHLLDISRLEQEIACHDDHSSQISELKKELRRDDITVNDALRLVLIYAFKYGNTNEIPALKKLLQNKGYNATKLIDSALDFVAKNRSTAETVSTTKKSLWVQVMKKFQDEEVQNVFTQHKPLLHTVLDLLFKGQLSESTYPYYSLTPSRTATPYTPIDVIVFIVGGATYEEALTVHNFNFNQEDVQQQPTRGNSNNSSNSRQDRSVVLGGTTILNSQMFLRELSAYHKKFGKK